MIVKPESSGLIGILINGNHLPESTPFWLTFSRVSYDDAETYELKKNFANNLCLGGTMVWALDQEDKDSRESSKDLTGNDLKFPGELGEGSAAFYQNRAAAFHLAQDYGLAMFWTACQPYDIPKCPIGFKAFAYGHGKVRRL